ncbi:serine/threonine-protein kinase [Klenkia taihuensis]|uniref:non-specific serine/threonine protein kinase n=1 Tax=Klenkia taihuensis TaxID=1225127 RepID=A0A1I1GHX5_9ACTN|nr:serine/threonine-protein kinase [Klenkia taihuensis]GHE09749.1 hypothetical protein GCM10011381_15960 [Klenkia taihuensis]SFC11035.1 serine/threonine protein kinase [Klenkia taihuensis]
MHELETRVLGDRYELRSVIATGGMGRVWRALDLRLRRPVAVKLLRGEFAGDAEFIARFRAEARHAALLRDEHVAAVYDYGETGADGEQLAWLVMELVEGEPLSALRRREGALDADRVVDLLRQAASGLAAAHAAGVVHRDVKPGNLLVRPDGSLTITDFGIAWSAASVSLTGTGEVIGTAHYLSPEQAQGRQATAASDVYGLGMVGYELLTGRRAFPGDSPVAVVVQQIHEEPEPLPDTVPAGVRQLLAAMLTKDPAQRLADGAAVLAAVERLVERGLGPATEKLPPARHRRAAAPRAGRRRRVLLGTGAAAGLAGVLAAGALLLGGTEGTPAAEAAPATGSAAVPTPVPSAPADPAAPAGSGAGWSAPPPVPQLGAATGTGLGQAVPTTPAPTTTAAPSSTGTGGGDEDGEDDDRGGGRGDGRGDGRGGGLGDLVPGWPFPGRGD